MPKTFVSGYADDALFVDEGGFMTKKRLAGLLKGFQLDHYKLADIHFTTLTNHSWTLAYRITEYGSFGGKAFVNKAIISTVWAEQNHKLLCHLVQETTVK